MPNALSNDIGDAQPQVMKPVTVLLGYHIISEHTDTIDVHLDGVAGLHPDRWLAC